MRNRMPWNRSWTLSASVYRDPATIAIVGLGVSTATGVMGAISSAQTAKANARSQRDAALANEKILRENADQARREASRKEDLMRTKQRIAKGNQIAAIAESGIGFEGTGGDLVEQSDINAEMDNLSVRYEGEMQARDLNTRADFSHFDADVASMNGKSAGMAGWMGAAGAFASGASSYGSWQKKYGKA